MKAFEFCYWLQGLFELSEVKSLDERQTEIVRRHLALVFFHDLDRKEPDSEASQAVHDGKHFPSSVASSADPYPDGKVYRC